MTRILLLISLVLGCNIVFAQTYEFNDNCKKAYENVIALKLDSGRFYLQAEARSNPKNLIPQLIDNYIAFLEIYTINSDAIYKERKSGFESRLKALKQGNDNSPYHLYAQAEVHLQAAVLHIKFGEYFAALMDVKKSLKKLEENNTVYPAFIPNYKSIGTLNTILGSIPEQYQSGLSIFGLNGNVKKGMTYLLKAVNDDSSIFQHESAMIYAFLQLHISNDSELAWNTLKKNNFFNTDNLMDVYAIGHIGIHGTHNDSGILALQNRPSNSDYTSFPYLDFLMGLGKTYRLDADANVFFQRFLSKNEGKDYVKSAYHKMAWNELIAGNEVGYQTYLNKVKNSGRSVIDTDKQAESELSHKQAPHAVLLKARLLSDGNYLSEAKAILEQKVVTDFVKVEDKTEYFYRFARVNHKLNSLGEAKQYYKLTISNGQEVPFYFAANSAYQMGYILEAEDKWDESLSYYDLSISLDGYEYDNSIAQKAKAGINRIKYSR